ncbi:hypothetical protein GCM10010470_02380 [Saccharopolyspora taberi]|uniref:Uncharacterized protein n=1 Tax=Saccharopolyspora taberi TaxID=60895 RepID=A0ABN3V0T1_9PSEU
MAASNVAVVRDQDGRVHYGAAESKFVREGLANGTLEEVSDAGSSNAPAGDAGESRSSRRGSGDRKRASGATDSDTK